MERVFQEFPMMIFHPVEKPVIVKDVVELDGYLAKGWRKSPFQIGEMERLEREINYHEEETLRLKGELDALKEDMKVPEPVPLVPLVESAPEEYFEDAQPIAPVVEPPAPVTQEVPTKVSRRIRK